MQPNIFAFLWWIFEPNAPTGISAGVLSRNILKFTLKTEYYPPPLPCKPFLLSKQLVLKPPGHPITRPLPPPSGTRRPSLPGVKKRSPHHRAPLFSYKAANCSSVSPVASWIIRESTPKSRNLCAIALFSSSRPSSRPCSRPCFIPSLRAYSFSAMRSSSVLIMLVTSCCCLTVMFA